MEENRKENGKRGGREESRKRSREDIDPRKLATVIWRRKKFIAVFTVSVASLTLVVSLLLTPIYRSSAVILPIDKTMPSILEGSDLSSIIGLLGIGGGSSTSKIMAILQTNSIKERILIKHDLMKVIFDDEWDEKLEEWEDDPPDIWDGIRAFEKIVEIEEDRKTGAISITTDFKDPQLAGDISNWFVEELGEILREKSFSMARYQRENIEDIFGSVGGHLKPPEGDPPDFTVFMQKMRDLTVSERAYEQLLIQYYIAKFQESKDDIVFQVIDEAKAPDKPERPKKILNTLIGIVVGLLLSVLIALVTERKHIND